MSPIFLIICENLILTIFPHVNRFIIKASIIIFILGSVNHLTCCTNFVTEIKREIFNFVLKHYLKLQVLSYQWQKRGQFFLQSMAYNLAWDPQGNWICLVKFKCLCRYTVIIALVLKIILSIFNNVKIF